MECFIGNMCCVKILLYLLNSEDDDFNIDLNDIGLGSEIEYCFDGLVKLDVYF